VATGTSWPEEAKRWAFERLQYEAEDK
jgi:hypothetical protein